MTSSPSTGASPDTTSPDRSAGEDASRPEQFSLNRPDRMIELDLPLLDLDLPPCLPRPVLCALDAGGSSSVTSGAGGARPSARGPHEETPPADGARPAGGWVSLLDRTLTYAAKNGRGKFRTLQIFSAWAQLGRQRMREEFFALLPRQLQAVQRATAGVLERRRLEMRRARATLLFAVWRAETREARLERRVRRVAVRNLGAALGGVLMRRALGPVLGRWRGVVAAARCGAAGERRVRAGGAVLGGPGETGELGGPGRPEPILPVGHSFKPYAGSSSSSSAGRNSAAAHSRRQSARGQSARGGPPLRVQSARGQSARGPRRDLYPSEWSLTTPVVSKESRAVHSSAAGTSSITICRENYSAANPSAQKTGTASRILPSEGADWSSEVVLSPRRKNRLVVNVSSPECFSPSLTDPSVGDFPAKRSSGSRVFIGSRRRKEAQETPLGDEKQEPLAPPASSSQQCSLCCNKVKVC